MDAVLIWMRGSLEHMVCMHALDDVREVVERRNDALRNGMMLEITAFRVIPPGEEGQQPQYHRLGDPVFISPDTILYIECASEHERAWARDETS